MSSIAKGSRRFFMSTPATFSEMRIRVYKPALLVPPVAILLTSQRLTKRFLLLLSFQMLYGA